MACIVYPSTSRAKSPVVVVVHEIYGLSTWVRGVADQVAAEGFIAIAPDLNSRVRGGPSTDELPGDSAPEDHSRRERRRAEQGNHRRGELRDVTAVGRAEVRRDRLLLGRAARFSCTRSTAARRDSPAASRSTAAVHDSDAPDGQPCPIADSLAKIKTPVMLLSGSKDARIGAAMPAVDSMMKALGKNYMGKNYEGAVHGFLRAQDDPKAARDRGRGEGQPRRNEGWLADHRRLPQEEESRTEVT